MKDKFQREVDEFCGDNYHHPYHDGEMLEVKGVKLYVGPRLQWQFLYIRNISQAHEIQKFEQ